MVNKVNNSHYFTLSRLKLSILITIIGWLFTITVKAQNYSFSKAIKLGENINSTSEESMPVLSPKGDKLYFVRTFCEENIGGKLSGQDIWMSIRNEFNEWEPSSNNPTNLNNQRNNAVIGFNSDGSSMYLLNSYGTYSLKIHGIAKSIRLGNEWSKPYSIKVSDLESDNGFVGFSINGTEDVLLISMNSSNSVGEEDIYLCLKDKNGQWDKPQNLGTSINTKGFEISPFLSEDGQTLFFSSDGHKGYGGTDIFMSRRLDDSWVRWSKPINLGKEVNSEGFDAYLSLHGNEAYFVSTRDGNLADIYQTELVAVGNKKEHAEINLDKFKLTETEIQEFLGMPVGRTIFFDFESFEVAASSRELIYFLANKLATNFQFSIELTGHTSDEGTDEFNQKLSLERADAVAKYFEDFGISPDRVSTSGVGESQPLTTDGTEEGNAKNRRVEIYFVK